MIIDSLLTACHVILFLGGILILSVKQDVISLLLGTACVLISILVHLYLIRKASRGNKC
jgi:uncharacterized membrane protein